MVGFTHFRGQLVGAAIGSNHHIDMLLARSGISRELFRLCKKLSYGILSSGMGNLTTFEPPK